MSFVDAYIALRGEEAWGKVASDAIEQYLFFLKHAGAKEDVTKGLLTKFRQGAARRGAGFKGSVTPVATKPASPAKPQTRLPETPAQAKKRVRESTDFMNWQRGRVSSPPTTPRGQRTYELAQRSRFPEQTGQRVKQTSLFDEIIEDFRKEAWFQDILEGFRKEGKRIRFGPGRWKAKPTGPGRGANMGRGRRTGAPPAVEEKPKIRTSTAPGVRRIPRHTRDEGVVAKMMRSEPFAHLSNTRSTPIGARGR